MIDLFVGQGWALNLGLVHAGQKPLWLYSQMAHSLEWQGEECCLKNLSLGAGR